MIIVISPSPKYLRYIAQQNHLNKYNNYLFKTKIRIRYYYNISVL